MDGLEDFLPQTDLEDFDSDQHLTKLLALLRHLVDDRLCDDVIVALKNPMIENEEKLLFFADDVFSENEQVISNGCYAAEFSVQNDQEIVFSQLKKLSM